ncbi:hypothetical protein HDE_02777 [Halotydeus destructor]|nr:hypothetical protein HDE_02777 [Halotydeus destructor]
MKGTVLCVLICNIMAATAMDIVRIKTVNVTTTRPTILDEPMMKSETASPSISSFNVTNDEIEMSRENGQVLKLVPIDSTSAKRPTLRYLSAPLADGRTSILIPLPADLDERSGLVFVEDIRESDSSPRTFRTHIFMPRESSPTSFDINPTMMGSDGRVRGARHSLRPDTIKDFNQLLSSNLNARVRTLTSSKLQAEPEELEVLSTSTTTTTTLPTTTVSLQTTTSEPTPTTTELKPTTTELPLTTTVTTTTDVASTTSTPEVTTPRLVALETTLAAIFEQQQTVEEEMTTPRVVLKEQDQGESDSDSSEEIIFDSVEADGLTTVETLRFSPTTTTTTPTTTQSSSTSASSTSTTTTTTTTTQPPATNPSTTPSTETTLTFKPSTKTLPRQRLGERRFPVPSPRQSRPKASPKFEVKIEKEERTRSRHRERDLVIINRLTAEAEETPLIVPGLAGNDYPTYSEIPRTSFDCQDMDYSGFYADLETNCQVYHSCNRGRKHSFLCPNGTIFSQEYLICDWWYNVDCSESPDHYSLNKEAFSPTIRKKKEKKERTNSLPSSRFAS